MIHVKTNDGTTLELPDTATDAEIEAAAQAHIQRKPTTGASLGAAPLEALNSATLGASDWVSSVPNWLIHHATGGKKSLGQLVDEARAYRKSALQNDLGETGGEIAQAGLQAIGTVAPAMVTGGSSMALKGLVGAAPELGALRNIAGQATVGAAQGVMQGPGDQSAGGVLTDAAMGGVGGALGGSLASLPETIRPAVANWILRKYKKATPEMLDIANKAPGRVLNPLELGSMVSPEGTLLGKAIEGRESVNAQMMQGAKEARGVLRDLGDQGFTVPVSDVQARIDELIAKAPQGAGKARDAYLAAVEDIKQRAAEQARIGVAPGTAVAPLGSAPLATEPDVLSPLGIKNFIGNQSGGGGLRADAGNAYQAATMGAVPKESEKAYKDASASMRAMLESAFPEYAAAMAPVAERKAALGALPKATANQTQEEKILNNLAAYVVRGKEFGGVMGGNPMQGIPGAVDKIDALTPGLNLRDALNEARAANVFGQDLRRGSSDALTGALGGDAAAEALATATGKKIPYIGPAVGIIKDTIAKSGGGIALRMLEDQQAFNTFAKQNPQYKQILQTAMSRGGSALPAALSTIINQDPAARSSAESIMQGTPQ